MKKVEEIIGALEKRRTLFAEEYYSKDSPLEEKHQIYGALNEIELAIKTLRYYLDSKNGTKRKKP